MCSKAVKEHQLTGGLAIKASVVKLTERQFKLVQRSNFPKWHARDEGNATTIKELLARYTTFLVRSDGALFGVMADSMGRSERHLLDERFTDERGFKTLQFQFPSYQEEF